MWIIVQTSRGLTGLIISVLITMLKANFGSVFPNLNYRIKISQYIIVQNRVISLNNNILSNKDDFVKL